MNAVRPLRRLLQMPPRGARQLTTTPPNPYRNRRRLKAEPESYTTPPPTPYTSGEISKLSKYYTNDQVASLLEGESAIDPAHFHNRRRQPDHDPMKLQYFDDLSTLDPILDSPWGPQIYTPGHPLQPLPRLDHLLTLSASSSTATASSATSDPPWMREVSLKTGFSVAEIRRLRTKILVSHSVVNQTRMGKIRKIYCLSVAGNGNGLVGIGEGKSVEHSEAQRMATYMAIRNMMPVPRYEDRTIFGNLDIKVGAVELKLFSRPPGFGLRTSQYIFEIAKCLGLSDLSAKVSRSRNPMNVCKATIQALRSQKLPETIARGRGKKLVDVRKVYYNGAV
ncbi:unnamed protein product [Tuber melanosporum]|uniref:Small ribosomal subunit protein uS5m n=1 Tax=Tuber melanosporum (strain Mel28) TaxID=656061 RepID=D5G3U9_TUBMM|nr:uncharacterized protein GSTUM_00003812001 [Tuber melanosporum]CAZ79192.1 unnamed protein product [Tuber melanosporum]